MAGVPEGVPPAVASAPPPATRGAQQDQDSVEQEAHHSDRLGLPEAARPSARVHLRPSTAAQETSVEATQQKDWVRDKPAAVEHIILADEEREAKQAKQAMRAELVELRVGALRQRGKAAGVDMEALNEAFDEWDKPAAVELIIKALATKGGFLDGVR